MRSKPQDEVTASEINANHGKPQDELNANKVTAGVNRNNLNRRSKPQIAKRRSQQSKTVTVLAFCPYTQNSKRYLANHRIQ